MNVQPVHQLASAIHSSPKLFACVLGSGISRTAGIRTGWEILLDLVQRHAEQLGEGLEAAKDPARWYTTKYGKEPDYSDVVAALAPTAELRRNLLEPYFTVRDEVAGERREHEPTSAHRALAKLVQRGLLRVIVTTNFDRLMENALREAGVANFEVVSSDEEAANCYPFHASQAFVFKVHGDWRDTWLRNSKPELAEYPRAITKLLRRIASEHGLIVCGWSAEYDVALRQTIARYQRRFPAYFVDPKPGANASKLALHLRATQIAARGDEFFSELELAVEALDRQRPPPTLSGDVLIARARRLIGANREMELDDLVQDATRAVCRWLEQEFAPTYEAGSRGSAIHDRANELASACEQQVAPLARLLATLTRYKQAAYLAQRSLSALLRSAETKAAPMRAMREGWWWFLSYPALLCAYAHGVSCSDTENWQAAITAVRDAGSGEAVDELRLPPERQHYFFTQMFPGPPAPSQLLRFTNRIAGWLFPHTESWIPRRADFERAFDRFDVLLCVLSLRPNAHEWKPRCSIARDVMDPPSARLSFDEVVTNWLIRRYEYATYQGGDEPLLESFAGCDLEFEQIIDSLRAWNPAQSA